jgi:hypothetical protein
MASKLDRIILSLLTEFSKEFEITDQAEDNRFEQFTAWLTVRRHYTDSTFNPAELWTEGGDDTGIDAIGVIVNNNLITDVDMIEDLLEVNGYLDVTFVFVQAERSPNFDSAKIGTFGNGVRDFFGDGQLKRNKKVKDYVDIMTAIYEQGSKFKSSNPNCHLYYVTTGKWNKDQNLVARMNAEEELLKDTNQFGHVQFHPVGSMDIQRLYRQTKNAISKEFEFEKRILLPEVAGVKEAYLGFVPANEFLALVRDEVDGSIVKSLFYENVRDWYGYNDINKEIRQTLKSEMRDRFVLMNNGITIIVRNLQAVRDRFTISDFHVVNGCQTSYVLYDNRDLISDQVQVPLRLICTQDEEVFEAVIRATNRQTEIRGHQFFAMREFAKKLEAYFRTFPVDKRLYYERRSNQYVTEGIEKKRIITHQDLVRAVGAMFLGDAHITTRNFRALKEKVGDKFFCDTDQMEPYYVAALCLYRGEELFAKRKLDPRYKPARYQILLTMRLLMDSKLLPRMNSRNMANRCERMIEILSKEQKTEKLFKKAAKIIDEIAGPDWDRDTIRTEPKTAAIFERFGLKYGQKRQESAEAVT